MRRFIGLLMLTCAAWAQTQIQDTIYTPFSGQLFEGMIAISGPAMKTQDGRTVARWTKQIAISNGALDIGLEPNDTATPQGASYTIIYRPKSGFGWTEYWIVPTSAAPLRISDVRIAQPPVPEMMIQPSQILDGGAADDQVLTWDASVRRWVAQTVTIDVPQITSGALPLARGGTNQTSWTAGRCVQVSADGTQLESASAACGPGGGGGVGGSGTAGAVALWTDTTTLGNSSITESQEAINAGKKLIVAGPIESQSTEPGAAVLYSASGGSVAVQAPDTATDWTLTAPAANGILALEGHEHDASAITSGAFADARVAESNVTQHQGALQLGASQITSGTLGLARGGTNQTSWTAGRCVQVSADGTKLESASEACATGGSSGGDPMDTTTLVLRDDFCSGGTSGGQIGELGWMTSTVAGTAVSASYNVGSPSHPCELRGIGVSSVNANDGRSMYLSNPTASFHNATGTANWEAKFIWQYPTYASELRTRVGLVKSDEYNVLVPTAFMEVRFDVDANWDPGGTKFIACVCNGNTKSNCTDVNTGLTVSADTWYKLRIWSDATGVIKMQLNDGNTITLDNPSTLPGSTIDFQPVWIVGRTGGTGNRQAYVDFFATKVTGLSR